MLDPKFLRENTDLVIERISLRGEEIDVSGFKELDEKRRTLLVKVETLKHERNSVSDEIAKIKKEKGDAGEFIHKMKGVSNEIKALDEELNSIDEELKKALALIPNIPHESVPVGTSDEDNVEVRKWGTPPKFEFTPLDHADIGERLGIIDFTGGAKLAGARFTLSKGQAAQLERALISFMLDIHTREHGYTEMLPPFMVNTKTMTGTGQLPKFVDDLFKVEDTDYWLIPTAEVPLTNVFQDEIIDGDELPIYMTAYTPCFRKEAGSYGKDTRGLIRQHQFSKVELVKFTKPEDSYDELEKLLANAEEILKRLNIHYRVVNLCTGDIGFSSSKTYDIEVWLPGQNEYREISSCSNCEDFQARRANIRFREKGKKGTAYVHTLNGSGLAVGRTLIAILENYQRPDGKVEVPGALRPYMGGLELIG
ncbi:MAG: serine--tRNA ligase [Deltaproteobacteria bacterium]|uniref:Serine--tRNA ligase n=1 Tax=Candidatus Zymogenus saltonus TaxID=2844893 RepID=A0A9D8KDH5_9DELT|nr:serine--tRNA ligase [Candidatus Zymogenus saltonus]